MHFICKVCYRAFSAGLHILSKLNADQSSILPWGLSLTFISRALCCMFIIICPHKCIIDPPPTQPPPPPGICVSAETMSSSLCVPYVSRLMCPFMMCVPSYSSPYSCDSFTLCQQQPCDPWFDLVWLLCPPPLSCSCSRLGSDGLQAAAAPGSAFPIRAPLRGRAGPLAFSSVPSEVEQAGGHLVRQAGDQPVRRGRGGEGGRRR